MPRFRARAAVPQDLAAVIAEGLRPGNFFTGPGVRLDWQFRSQVETPWEVFRGRLLAAAQTRARQRFDTWDVYLTTPEGRSAEPVISIKHERTSDHIHVTRAIECYVWEPYDAGANVILSREVRQWVPELVGTIAREQFPDFTELHDELLALLFQAVVGSSRLPLTSSEAPLPGFTLGLLGYFHRAESGDRPLHTSADLLRVLGAELSWLEQAKLLELAVRATPPAQVEETACLLARRWADLGHDRPQLAALFRTMINEVALSPYTDFVDNTLALLQACVRRGYLATDDLVDLLCHVLRQVSRHLTAYDLITFHHRGANYPDALMLDAMLKLVLQLLGRHPELFLASVDSPRLRLRRRALRQAWLLRRQYEGLPVPDLPVSPGENLRVLPPPFFRVPNEQIVDPTRRTRRLYDGDPLSDYENEHTRAALAASVRDLDHVAELHELGTALFADRPFGAFKALGEPDQTMLFSHVAFSLSVAERRLNDLAEKLSLLPADNRAAAAERLRASCPHGISLTPGPRGGRPGVVSARDAEMVAADFVFLRTTGQTWRAFLAEYDFSSLLKRFSLEFLNSSSGGLILGGNDDRPGAVTVYDAALAPRLQLQVDASLGYRHRAGREYPAAGLQVARVLSGLGEPAPVERLVIRPVEY